MAFDTVGGDLMKVVLMSDRALRFGWRHVSSLAMASLVAVGLGGCLPIEPGDEIEARLDGDTVRFTVCERFSANEFRVRVRELGSAASNQHDAWVIVGEPTAQLREVVYGVVLDGMTEVHGPESVSFADSFVQFEALRVDAGERVVDSRLAAFDGASLSTEYWLGNDGHKSSSACE